jgi:hypothetical protein
VNNLAITPCLTDAVLSVKRAAGLERTRTNIHAGILGATLPGRRRALHILILSFSLYRDLPSHNDAYVFFGHTGSPKPMLSPHSAPIR